MPGPGGKVARGGLLALVVEQGVGYILSVPQIHAGLLLMRFAARVAVLLAFLSYSFGQQLVSLAGQSGTLTLLSDVSSRNQKNSQFQAKLSTELKVDNQTVLPQGTMFQGHLEPERARRRLRQGSLQLVFDQMMLPNGQIHSVNAVVTSVQLRSVSVDAE